MKKLIFRAVPGESNLQIAMPGQNRKLYNSHGSPYDVDEAEYAFLMKHAGHLFHLPIKTNRRAASGKFVSSKSKADEQKADVPKAGKSVLTKIADKLKGAPEESKGQEESGEAKD